MITLYEKGAEIKDPLTGLVVGYETRSVNFPDFIYEQEGIEYDWTNKTVKIDGKTYFKQQSTVENVDADLIARWDSIPGYHIERIYYTGIEAGNPSGKDNLQRQNYIDDKNTVCYYRTYTWDASDNNITETLYRTLTNSNQEEEHKEDDVTEQESDPNQQDPQNQQNP